MKQLIIAAAMAVAMASAAASQTATKGPNGGPVVETHDVFVEMTVEGDTLVLHFAGADGKPITSDGTTKARAVVQDAGKTSTVPLETQAPNRLVGTLAAPLGSGARVVVSATLADGHGIQARFVNN
jgi:predicted secreted protein